MPDKKHSAKPPALGKGANSGSALSKGKIEAIKNLLEKGKQLKRKVRGTKVAPAVLACPSALV